MNLSKEHLEILEYSDSLFARWNLRKNTYLFKHIKSNLEIPLFIIAEERHIAQITQVQATLIEALKLSDYVEINEESRMIKIVELPALRFQDEAHLLKVEGMVKNWIKEKIENRTNVTKPLEYVTSSRTDDGWYYLVLKSKAIKDKTILKELITKYNSENEQKIKYHEEPMYEDIKNGVSRQRKMKREMLQKEGGYRNYQNSYNQNEVELKIPTYSRQNMGAMYSGLYYNNYEYQNMGMSPEQMYTSQGQTESKFEKVFIRRAVESSDEDTVREETPKNEATISQTVKTESLSTKTPQSPSKVTIECTEKKIEAKNTKNKKQENNKKEKQDKQEKQPKNKVVLDDSDFPTIG